MKTSIGILLVVALLALSSPVLGQSKWAENNIAKGRSKGAERLIFSGVSAKSVDFAHQAHQQIAGECDACHHMGVGTGDCSSCHDGDSRFSSKKDALHANCIGCHTKMAVSAASDCLFCHKDTGTGVAPDNGTTDGKKGKKSR